MNRSTFFKALGLGILSAPTVAKAILTDHQQKPTHLPYYNGELKWVHNPDWDNAMYDVDFHFNHTTDAMKKRIARHIAFNDPYAGIFASVDDNPIRYSR